MVILTRCHVRSKVELLGQISGYWPTLILFKSCGIMMSSVSYNTSYPFIHPSILTIHMLTSAFVCSNSPDCDNSANDVAWHPTCWGFGFFILRLLPRNSFLKQSIAPSSAIRAVRWCWETEYIYLQTLMTEQSAYSVTGVKWLRGTPHLIIGTCTIES